MPAREIASRRPRRTERIAHGLVLLVRAIFRGLSPERAVAIGAGVGRLIARVRGPRTGVAYRNLEIAFPGWSREQRRRAVTSSFANVGRSVAEIALLSGRHRETLLDRIRFDGIEHLRAAQGATSHHGVILLTAHLGNWEMGAVAMARAGIPLTVVHHGFDNPLLGSLVTDWRRSGGMQTLELGSAGLGAVRALRRGRVVAMLFDQNANRDEGRFVPFFGVDACTRAGPALLAMRLGVPVVPAFLFRDGFGTRHIAKLSPALEIEPPGADPEAALYRNLCRMNLAIERAVREAPDQWLWLHKRWKTRPPADPRALYPRRRGVRKVLRRWLAASSSSASRA